VGAEVAGCPSPAVEVGQGDDQVWYAAGYSNGDLQSVGIASQLHGGAIFLDGGIAQYVLGELQTGQAVSGSARINIGSGDLQLVYSAVGTTAFVRPTKHRTDNPTIATTQLIVPPAAVPLWLSAMTTDHRFLWPSYQSGSYQASSEWCYWTIRKPVRADNRHDLYLAGQSNCQPD
jgi:hypothetical protein